MHFQRYGRVALLWIAVLLCAAPARPQSASGAPQAGGTLTGQVTDQVGAPIQGAGVTLVREGTSGRPTAGPTTSTGEDGGFSFVDVPPGPFRLTVTAAGFASFTQTGELAAGETIALAPVRLTLAAGTIAIDVTPTPAEVAERQVKEQEQQRVLGIFPNFNVSFDPHPAPLNAHQKFELTWKSMFDPIQFGSTAVLAGLQQARNDYPGFGGGAGGYGKRYAALYATIFTGTVLSHAVIPAILKQDPRYILKGSGSTWSRVGYALSRTVVRTGDNGRAQPDYSRIFGRMAAGALSNLYYPAANRHGAALTFTNTGVAIVGAAVGNLMQEFVLKRFTTHARQ